MKRIEGTIGALALSASALACAAGPKDATPDAAKVQYDAERARCLSGTTGQDQASCLKSAGAAYDAIRQNRLHDANGNYRDNAIARCQMLPAGDRADCLARIDGGGAGTSTTSGSVQGGGLVTETVTKTAPPATPPAPK